MIALALLVTLGQAGEGSPFLHELKLESTLSGPVVWPEVVLAVSARTADVSKAAFAVRRGLKPGSKDLVVTKLDQVLAKDKPLPRHTKASWVIDFDQKAFIAALDALKEQKGDKPSVDDIVAFAADYLTRKSYDRGFDLASQVATRRGGDCTEHAVFLAGLLRFKGVPARTVMGMALVPQADAPGGKPAAFGHMWVEAFVGGAWRIADAALPQSLNAAYLPAGELTDEGPGYAMSLFTPLNTMAFERLELRAK